MHVYVYVCFLVSVSSHVCVSGGANVSIMCVTCCESWMLRNSPFPWGPIRSSDLDHTFIYLNCYRVDNTSLARPWQADRQTDKQTVQQSYVAAFCLISQSCLVPMSLCLSLSLSHLCVCLYVCVSVCVWYR